MDKFINTKIKYIDKNNQDNKEEEMEEKKDSSERKDIEADDYEAAQNWDYFYNSIVIVQYLQQRIPSLSSIVSETELLKEIYSDLRDNGCAEDPFPMFRRLRPKEKEKGTKKLL